MVIKKACPQVAGLTKAPGTGGEIKYKASATGAGDKNHLAHRWGN